MRLAGTWKQYSAKAMSQLITMTLKSGADRYLRCPYQANVIKMLDRVRSRIVIMDTMLPHWRFCCLPCRILCLPGQGGWAARKIHRFFASLRMTK